jgi:hypothetical protein
VNLTVLIERNTHYRLFGPIIDEALGRGWDVECWHDQAWPRHGRKGYQFPAIDQAPRFRHGTPRFRVYHGADDRSLRDAIRDRVVLSLKPPDEILGAADATASGRPFWVMVQHAIDPFVTFRPEQLLACDAFAVYSDWWIDWAAEQYHVKGLVANREAFARELRSRAWVVGFPALDASSLVDPAEVRLRWGLPSDRPIVLHLPFGQGMGTATLWPRGIFGEPRRWRQILNSLAHARLDYWRDIVNGWNDAHVVDAIRTFCDRNDAFLLVKSRLKTPIPSDTAAAADKCLYDEQQYPATILEALAVSDLCVSFYSATVLEAAFAGVPHVCVAYDVEDYWGRHQSIVEHERLFFNTRLGGIFNFAGVSHAFSIPEAIESVPGASLSAFTTDAAARSFYVRKYLGLEDRSATYRLIDALERQAHGASPDRSWEHPTHTVSWR